MHLGLLSKTGNTTEGGEIVTKMRADTHTGNLNCESGASMETHLNCFKPARLLDLVVDDGLVLEDPLVPGAGEDHILEREKKPRVSYPTRQVIWLC